MSNLCIQLIPLSRLKPQLHKGQLIQPSLSRIGQFLAFCSVHRTVLSQFLTSVIWDDSQSHRSSLPSLSGNVVEDLKLVEDPAVPASVVSSVDTEFWNVLGWKGPQRSSDSISCHGQGQLPPEFTNVRSAEQREVDSLHG